MLTARPSRLRCEYQLSFPSTVSATRGSRRMKRSRSRVSAMLTSTRPSSQSYQVNGVRRSIGAECRDHGRVRLPEEVIDLRRHGRLRHLLSLFPTLPQPSPGTRPRAPDRAPARLLPRTRRLRVEPKAETAREAIWHPTNPLRPWT